MPKVTPPETVADIKRMLDAGIGYDQIAAVVGMTANGVRGVADRLRFGSPDMTINFDITTKPVIETDDMSARFAEAMNGQRFESFNVKAYGRPVAPHPSHVMTQSSAGNCVDVA